MKQARGWILASVFLAAGSLPSWAEGIAVTLLGTGTPVPSLDAFGPATLVEAAGQTLLFDAGRGVAMQLSHAGVRIGGIDAVFLTHHHSDHVTGLDDVLLTGWLPFPPGRRIGPLPLVGPPGVGELAEGFAIAFARDRAIREASLGLDPAGMTLEPRPFTQDGVVWEKGGLTVTAFEVPHGEHIKPAYGFRIDYADNTVVLSGDTAFSETVIEQATGADLLVHEVFAANAEVSASPAGKAIASHHTSPEEAGEVFTQARPALAVFTHVALLPPAPPTRDEVLARTRAVYNGRVEMGQDGMRIVASEDGIRIVN
ncbi:Ribonuclease Z [Roseivivax jejudonensis]|uniref:Ribonuclease Z n=1 Tax=Roseivivax jejudonensis TaxID=1529041 RepID=A0A1X7A873_9RHOB|nr:MBL fold metallo-hydrolase [Roseivivax jejudonensis]SLN71305.1 Ribonuclease Z [Roseivivax jejudonensis]